MRYFISAVGLFVKLTMDKMVTDLGDLDDNLTLPILSGGCIWGFLKLFSWFSS